MKCPHCGAKVLAGDKFCGDCGKKIIITDEIPPLWKWGSMIASLLIIIWILYESIISRWGWFLRFSIFWAIFAFPAIIYLMYKERLEKTKYEQKLKYAGMWFLTLILLLIVLMSTYTNSSLGQYVFLLLIYSPPLIIDCVYLYTTKNK